MKRLVKKNQLEKINDAARLQSLYINPNIALDYISQNDSSFSEDGLMRDTGANTSAYWGAISDDGQYIMEAYIYKVMDNMKCAYVVAKIENEEVGSDLEVITYNITGAREARQIPVNEGLIMNNGTKLTFSNEYTTIEEIEVEQLQIENI